jgi:hypothetical protein
MPRATTASPPGVEIRAPEVELATRTVLLGRDRPLGSELAQRVSVQAEVVGCGTGVESIIVLIRVIGKPVAQQCHDPLGQPIDELVNDRPLGRATRLGRQAQSLAGLGLAAVRLGLIERASSSRSCVAYAAIVGTSFKGLGQASGCCCTAGAAFCLQSEASKSIGRMRLRL